MSVEVVPSIHPFAGLNEPGLVFHTKEFAEKTITPDGEAAIHDAVLALAHTGYDIIVNKDLLHAIKQEFENR